MIFRRKISIGQYQSQTGWGVYVHNGATTISVGTTPTKFTVDSLNSGTYEGQLPIDANGASLWDSVNNKITPISLDDSYDVRVSFEILSKTGTPTLLNYVLDIGDTGGITIPIFETTIQTDKTPPYTKGYSLPIFDRATFLANKGQIFFSTDTGTITIGARSIFIKRDHKGF